MADTQVAEQQPKQLTRGEYLKSMQDMIDASLGTNVDALPKGFNKQRFTLNCVAMMKDDLDKWSGIDRSTIVTAFMKGAYLGLDFFNGECYAIPYNSRNGKQVNFQTDYKGEIKLAKKYSKNPIKDIYAKNVRKDDFFEEQIIDGKQTVTFKPVPFSDKEIIGTFAVVVFKDGSMLYETMSKNEIEKIRSDFSKAADSPAWKKTPGEMYKKTVLRRLLKFIDLDFDTAQQVDAFKDGGDSDFHKEVVVDAESVEIHNPFEKQEEQGETIGGLALEEVE